MFGYKFFHGTIRRYVIVFGTLFNQVHIDRVDSNGDVTSTLRVPIVYGPRDKAMSRVESNPDFDKKFSSSVPFMSFELKGMRYDAENHLQPSRKEVGRTTNKNLAAWAYTPVPYVFTFELNISTKFMEDATKIIEQIVPFFTPDWTVTVKIMDEPIITRDVPVVLKDHVMSDTWEGSYVDKREIRHVLTFEMKAPLFGPVTKSKIIKVAKGQVAGFISGLGPVVTVQPGLTANGEPTDQLSESVDYSEISWEDDFGYITTMEDE